MPVSASLPASAIQPTASVATAGWVGASRSAAWARMTMALTWWATTSCSSRAMRVRSSTTTFCDSTPRNRRCSRTSAPRNVVPTTTNSANSTRDQPKPRASVRPSRSTNSTPAPARHTAPASTGWTQVVQRQAQHHDVERHREEQGDRRHHAPESEHRRRRPHRHLVLARRQRERAPVTHRGQLHGERGSRPAHDDQHTHHEVLTEVGKAAPPCCELARHRLTVTRRAVGGSSAERLNDPPGTSVLRTRGNATCDRCAPDRGLRTFAPWRAPSPTAAGGRRSHRKPAPDTFVVGAEAVGRPSSSADWSPPPSWPSPASPP